MRTHHWLSLGLGITLISTLGSGCMLDLAGGGDAELSGRSADYMVDAIGTARPIGLAVAAAMSAAHGVPEGGDIECVQVVAACTDYPCNSEAVLTVGQGCPAALGRGAQGSVRVRSHWTSRDDGEVSMEFDDVLVDGRGLVVVSANSVHARRVGTHILAQYDDSLVEVAVGRVLVENSEWTVDIDTVGTENDSSDDVYLVSGSTSDVAPTHVLDVSLENVLIVPECNRNPISGSAEVSEVSLRAINDLEIEFHDACDGRADVVDHTGITSAIRVEVGV